MATDTTGTSNLRRRRRSGSNSPAGDVGTTSSNRVVVDSGSPEDVAVGVKAQQRTETYPASLRPPLLAWILLLLHAIACGIYIAGLILQKKFHTSVECEMTYSQRQLIPIPLQAQLQHTKYSLHKFVDQRDPRPHHRAMLKEWLTIVKKTGNEEQVATEAYLEDKKQQQEDTAIATQQQQHCSPNNNNQNDTVAVLYIPGHWGSYMQSRSIGAHGIQLTGARDYKQAQIVTTALAQNDWKGMLATSLGDFQFDVYAINFQEEGAALHAKLLWAQTNFVAHAIQELVDTCQLSQIVILGHSIGGYVARLVPSLYPELRPYLSNIVTLGSPHAHPVFGWEPTVHHLHQTYLMMTNHNDNENDNDNASTPNAALVAISGGLRDEMIPPLACKAPNTSNTLSMLSPEIMKPGPKGAQPQFGMDHRAIVWCHNLLSVVRGVIYTLVKQDNQGLSSNDRISAVRTYLGLQEDYDYDKALQQHLEKFRQMYGQFPTIAMESAMLYHSELLVGLFVVLGCFQTIGNEFLGIWDWPFLPILATICLTAVGTNYQIQVIGITVLTLVANSIFWILQWIIGMGLPLLINKLSSSTHHHPKQHQKQLALRLRRIQLSCAGIFLTVLGGQCTMKLFDWQTRCCLAFLFAVYLGTLGTAVVVAAADQSQSKTTRLVQFAVTLFLATPFLVAGKIIALLTCVDISGSNLPVEYEPSWGLLVFTGKILLPTALLLVYHHSIVSRRDDAEEATRSVVLTLVVLYMGRSLFQMGQGYRAGDLLAILCWLECLFLPVIQ